MGQIKKLLLVILLIAVIVGSFWVSFLIGKTILLPTKQLPQSLVPPQVTSMATTEPGSSDISIEVESSLPDQPVVPQEKKIIPAAAVGANIYKVQVGVYKVYNNAKVQISALKQKGFEASIGKYGKLWRVLAGSFPDSASANKLVTSLKSSGFDAVVRLR